MLFDSVWESSLIEDLDKIHAAFSAESVQETKNRLRNMDTRWGFKVLDKMEMIDEHLLQKWFELTKYSSQPDCTLEDVYEKERLLSFQ